MPKTSSKKKKHEPASGIAQARELANEWSLDDVQDAFDKIASASDAELPAVLDDFSAQLDDMRERVNEAIDVCDDPGVATG